MRSPVLVVGALAGSLGGMLGCTKLSDQERCALDGQFAAGADITSTGRTIHCAPATNAQDACTLEVEQRYARRGHVIGGYRFFESDGDKLGADLEAMVGISACVTTYPCKGESCANR